MLDINAFPSAIGVTAPYSRVQSRVDRFDPDDSDAALVTRSGRGLRGKFPSAKCQRIARWRTEAVSLVYRLLEASPAVISYHEQPCKLTVIADEVWRHRPDLLVKFATRTEVWDVRTEVDSCKPGFERHCRLAAAALATQGIQYRVVDSDALVGPRFGNASKILQTGHGFMNVLQREELRQAIGTNCSVSWANFTRGHLPVHMLSLFCRLVIEGRYAMGIHEHLSNDTEFKAGDFTSKTWFTQRDFLSLPEAL